MQMPLILMFMEIMHNQPDNIGKLVAFADDFPVAGILTDLKFLQNIFCILGPKLGCYLQTSKSWLVVTKGHMGYEIWSVKSKDEYINYEKGNVIAEIRPLSHIAITQPPAAYNGFDRYKHKLTYYSKIIPEISHYFEDQLTLY